MERLRWGLIGGGEGSQIGPAHRLGARLDGLFDFTAGALDHRPDAGRAFGRTLGLAADRCAVFRIECDVEHGAEFRLQRQALAHAGLDAAIVIDDGQCRPWRLLPEQGDAGMKRYRHATTVPSLTRAFQLAARKSCVQH